MDIYIASHIHKHIKYPPGKQTIMEKFWWIVVPLPTVTVQLIWCKPPLFKPYAIIFSYSFNKGNITKRKERQQEKEKREREEDTDDTYG